MEYAVFVIGIIALIVSVVINGKIAERNENELKAIRMEMEKNVESRIKDYFDVTIANIQSFVQGRTDSLEEKLIYFSTKIENLDSDYGSIEHDLDDAVDRTGDAVDRLDDIEHLVYEAKENIIHIKNTIDIIVPATPFLEQDYATYLENDASVIKHIDATGYDISETILFMAYMLQDLKDKVYGKKIVTHEEPKTKTSTRRKKVSVSGDTDNTITGSKATQV